MSISGNYGYLPMSFIKLRAEGSSNYSTQQLQASAEVCRSQIEKLQKRLSDLYQLWLRHCSYRRHHGGHHHGGYHHGGHHHGGHHHGEQHHGEHHHGGHHHGEHHHNEDSDIYCKCLEEGMDILKEDISKLEFERREYEMKLSEHQG